MTFIAYPNLQAESEDGAFRVEIVGEPVEDFFRDQSGFVYRSFRSGRLAWEWKPAKAENGPAFLDDYPHEVWISNEGWVVVRTHEWFHAGLLVLSPAGEVVLRRWHRNCTEGGEPGFLDAEPEEYLGDTSAGPFWARCAIAYFSQVNGRACWTIRTWWGRRVVIDLAAGKFIELTAADRELAHRREVECIEKTLAAGVPRVQADAARLAAEDRPKFWGLASHVIAAAYHAGWLKATTCVPALRALEDVDVVGGTWVGGVSWASVEILPFCQAAKLSLLRLGQEPQWRSHFRFKLDADGQRFHFPIQAPERDPAHLQPGLTQQEVLRRIGAPDYIRNDWEYDYLSAQGEYTARLAWDESHLQNLIDESKWEQYRLAVLANPPRLASVEIVASQWKQISMRDHEVVCF